MFYKKSKKKSAKYGSIKCACSQGHIHMSRLESKHCDMIGAMQKDGQILSFEVQKKFDLCINGKKICSHYVDFLLEYQGGKKEVIESKGFETAIWILKHKIFEACYPDIKYSVWKK